jgi:acetylornithine/N-succinyldiaminopimelate aminotransferase
LTSADRSALMDTYAEPPVVFVRGSGTELWDTDGKRYLDFLCGIAVTSLGHAHPEVAAAVADQASQLLHTSNLFGTLPGARVAAALDRLVGDGERAGGKVFFSNSGAEANECAIKLARRFATGAGQTAPERHVIVSTLGSFHGRTLAALTATGQPQKHVGIGPVAPGFVHVEYDDLPAIESACDSNQVAAVILEPIQGEAGVIVPSPGYLRGVAEICTERGILLIADEVQTGLGRTGRWFGFHHEGIQPDIVTMAKALGNGMPIGACWASGQVAAAFGAGDHGTTFGGQPLAASAAEATLGVMERLDAPALAAHKGDVLRSKLEGLPGVVEVRGKGLLIGLGLTTDRAPEVVAEALVHGLVANAPRSDTVRLAPPFIVTDEQIAEAVEILAAVTDPSRKLREGAVG